MITLGPNALVLLGWDGILRRGHTPCPGAAEFLTELRDSGTHFLVLSNDSSCGPAGHAEAAATLGLPLDRDDFLTASMVAVSAIRIRFPGRAVYVVGSRELREELVGAGIPLAGESASPSGSLVLVGRSVDPDFDQVAAAIALLREGVPFLGANPNLTWPTEHGDRADCGAVCALLTSVTGREPILLGKPDPAIIEQALGLRLGTRREYSVLVGYDPVADGELAASAGIPFLRIGGMDAPAEAGLAYASPADLLDHIREARMTDPVLAAWHRAGSDAEQYF